MKPVSELYTCLQVTNMSKVNHISLASSTHVTPCHPIVVSVKLKPDMVLEDVESDNEGTRKHEHQSQAAAPSPSLTPLTSHQQQEASQQSSSLQSQKCSDTSPQAEQSESGAKMSLEDAETQTGRWTPFIESIKREAEDVALATMEER